MPQVINTNIASLQAQRALNSSQGDVSTALQRLSTGLRINTAKDDAAGLAISERFTAKIKGLNQGVRNANDGISLAQTAEGALKEVTSNLQRIRELAVQSANATNSTSDRAALKAEADQLVAEIDRVAAGTKFNGINLLDGTFSSQAFQVGADNGETVSITSISSARTTALGGSTSASITSGVVNTTATDGSNVTINGVAIAASADDGSGSSSADASAKAKAAAINATSGTQVTAAANATVETGALTSATNGNTVDLVINGVAVAQVTTTGVEATDTAAMKTAINAVSGSTGVVATGDDTAGLTLTAADGRNITVADTYSAGDGTQVGLAAAGTTTTGTITLTSSSSSITAGGTVAILGSPTTTALSSSGTAISSIDISTASGATTALTSVDAALSTISSTRSTLGSYQSRFESVVANAQTSAENLSASRSRIMDADFAQETAQLTKSQILQQSGIAMLAQANSIPQNVLALLQ